MSAWKEIGSAVIALGIAATPTSLPAGELGQTSRASVVISVTVPPRIEVDGIQEVPVSGIRSSGSASQPVCVLTNAPESAYSVTWLVSDTSGHGSPDEAGTPPPLAVEWADHRTSAAVIVPGTTVGGFQVGPGSNCRETGNASARLTVRTASGSKLSLTSRPAPLTLLIAPD